MYKIIGGDNQEYGPVTADELRQWIAEGRLSNQSLAQSEGANEWKPLASFPEFADALRAQAGQTAAAPSTTPRPAGASLTLDVLSRPAQLQIGRCLSRGWSLLAENFPLLAGAAALIGFLGMISQFIPLIGGVVYLLLRGVLFGGLNLVFLRRIRGQPASVNDAFAGFSLGLSQLMLAGAMSSLLSMIGWLFCFLPGIYLTVAWVFCVPLVADKQLEFWSAMELSRKVVTRSWFEVFALMIMAFLPFLVAYAIFYLKFTLALSPIMREAMAGHASDMARMMQTSFQIVQTIFPLYVLTQVVFVLNLPFAVGVLMQAYEDLFGPRTTPNA